ncbi:hypothetical protein ODS41_02600 [Pyrobaculum sp. 3827-6]|uniref:hypothetical protein n=1 Tax=Pyrobaculum sp. 3827-6 TaxID=2983604 RepID=UPI0021D8697F|nr:hypothetical protein [Pyrobaculum sp. 3827-6]MCU7786820.1 hypothetical protein [Pyrobaculum sp. 3827-6]
MGITAEALLDTSVLIEVLDRERLELLPDQPYLSITSLYEYIRCKGEGGFTR